MIDLKFLLENQTKAKQLLSKKHVPAETLENLINLHNNHKELLQKFENARSEQNKLSKLIPTASPEQKTELLKQSAELKDIVKDLEKQTTEAKQTLEHLALQIPNFPDESVPEGLNDTQNVIIKTVGAKPNLTFQPKDHLTLAKNLDLIEMEAAAIASGSRFYYLKNEAVFLQFALIQFTLQKLSKYGFKPVITPVLVKEQAMTATGFFPADKNEIYTVNPNEDNLFLVGTAEVPLSMLHANQILDSTKLPLRYAGYSSCFRREAGTYGKDTHGIFRVHQFEKVEMFIFSKPEESEAEHQLILKIEEEILTELGIHYQVVLICGGDLGAPAAKKYDIEAWIPSQEKYRELTSCSNYKDYTARRSQIRTKSNNQTSLIHTLNGTAMASTRTIIAILENYQNSDGSISIPKPLQPFMPGNLDKIMIQ